MFLDSVRIQGSYHGNQWRDQRAHSVLDQTSKEEQSLKLKLTSKAQATGLKDWVHGASDWCLGVVSRGQ